MTLQRIPAVYYRGGTSRGLVFKLEDLPADRGEWDAIFLSAMGVPDRHGRNLDGMGGGLSSLNKLCIVGPSTRADADVDYIFVQLSVNDAAVDFSGNCGNMSSTIGLFAAEEGLIPSFPDGEAAVRIHNVNTGKIIVSRFPVVGGLPATTGDLSIDGVAGNAAPVRLEFLEPGGAKTGKLLPTGHAVDKISVRPELVEGLSFAWEDKIEGRASTSSARTDFGEFEVSCIDAANPCVFVRASDVGKMGTESPAELEADTAWLGTMEAIRKAGAKAMGLADVPSIPKVAMVSAGEGADITIRMISVGQPHRAVPITGAICLAVAARVPGTIPHQLCTSRDGPITIAHASGTTQVDAVVRDGHAEYGAVYRTARRLFEGNVLYRAP